VPKRLNKNNRPNQAMPWKAIRFLLASSQTRKHSEEIIRRNVTTVKGGMLANAVLVAMKDIAQKKQAVIKANLAGRGTLSLTLGFDSFFIILYSIRNTGILQYPIFHPPVTKK
jgi:hypothetical protein